MAGRREPHRPVRLQAGTDQAARRARRTSARRSKPSRTDSVRGLRPDWDFKPYGQIRQDAQRSRRAARRRSSTRSRSSTTWSARPACTARARCCRRPASIARAFPAWAAGSATASARMNENLPTFVVLPDHRGLASNGTKNWDTRLPARATSGHGDLSRQQDADRRPVPRRPRDVHQPSRANATRIDLLAQLNRTTPRTAPATSGSTRASTATNSPPRCSSRRPKRSTSRKSRSTS